MSGISEDPEYQKLITGTITGNAQTIEFETSDPNLYAVTLTGTWTGTVVFEVTLDGSTWTAAVALDQSTQNKVGNVTGNGTFLVSTTGFEKCRVRSTAWTTGTLTANGLGSDVTSITYALQSGTWLIDAGDTITTGGTQGNLNLVVANTAYELKVGANRLTGRKLITALSVDAEIYWGYTNAVTTSTGTPIYKNQFYSWPMDATGSVWLICANANKNVRITETP